MRWSTSMRKRSPSALGDRLRLDHHGAGERAGAGVGADHVECLASEGADRVEGDVAPQLHPQLVAQARSHRSAQPGGDQRPRQPRRALGLRAVGLAEGEAIALDVADHARLGDLGGRVHHAADHPLRSDAVPQQAAGVDGVEPPIPPLPVEAVEVPPRHAVLRWHHRRLGPQQWPHALDDASDLVRLQRQDHVVLHARLGRVFDAARACDAALAVDQQRHAVRLHRRQVRAARDQRHVLARERELRAEVAADRARSIDGDLQARDLAIPTTLATSRGRAASPARCAGACPSDPSGSRRR